MGKISMKLITHILAFLSMLIILTTVFLEPEYQRVYSLKITVKKGPVRKDTDNETTVEINTFLNIYEEKCNQQLRRDRESFCACLPNSAMEQIIPYRSEGSLSWRDINDNHEELHSGGESFPTNCRSLETLAIIIPYRDREEHLKISLNHLHSILKNQKIHYRVFVVEQVSPETFNKGAIMNAAVLEIEKIFKFDCLIFHDVDMLVEDGRLMYNCVDAPRHIGALVQKYNYTFPCQCHVGGVLAIRPEQFRKINGYHILFYGWGDEDKDMLGRIKTKKLNVTRYPAPLAKFTMIKHERDKWNPPNRFRESILTLHTSANQIDKHGLNSLTYTRAGFKLKKSHTLIKVQLNIAQEFLFNKTTGNCSGNNHVENANSLEDCAMACFNHSFCVTFTYLSMKCKLYFKACLLDKKSKENIYIRRESNFPIEKHFTVKKGKCTLSTFATSTKFTLFDCAKLCLKEKRCKGFTFNNNSPSPCQRQRFVCSKRKMKNLVDYSTFIKKITKTSVIRRKKLSEYHKKRISRYQKKRKLKPK